MKDISFTFGIITYAEGGVSDLLRASVESIRSLKIPQYEIIIVGNQSILITTPDFQHSDVKLIHFDEAKKPKWITRKKNVITDSAKFENVVYQHDYLVYDSGWYEGYKQFGDNFQICINKQTNPLAIQDSPDRENRFRDLVLDMWTVGPKMKHLNINKRSCLIPYDEYDPRLSKFMYVNGTYWVAKRELMKRCRLNENLIWGQGEDVEFSKRARNMVQFSFNPHSISKLNKPGATIFKEMTVDEIRRFKLSVGIN